eukprot:TRINITY_DN17447_c0_g1_i1.p1 TRINITY_DN17447_c0_g1~~TRINITY_DN17447_c0_g1_i1.p1  ORF type:complete len:494 (+),score=90.64 TRINITY_DN17447_c0_g1_i1:80-1483(+)
MNKITLATIVLAVMMILGVGDFLNQHKFKTANILLSDNGDLIAKYESDLKKLKAEIENQAAEIRESSEIIANQTTQILTLEYQVEGLYGSSLTSKEDGSSLPVTVSESHKEEIERKNMEIWKLTMYAVRPWKRRNRTVEDLDPPAGFPVFQGIPKDFWDKLARVYPPNPLSPSQQRLPLCTNTATMIRGGKVNTTYIWGDWTPTTCRLAQADELKTCVNTTNIVIFGDSTGRALAHSLNNQIYHEKETYDGKISWSVGNKTRGWVKYMTFLGPGMPKPTSLSYKNSKTYAKEADVVIVAVGLWGMGRLATPIDKFIRELHRDLLELKAMMSPGKTLILRTNLIIFKWMSFDASVNRCNSPQKQLLFNVAIKDLASCVGAELLDTVPFLENWDNLTSVADGVHFGSKFEGELLINHFCRSGRSQLAYPSKPKCTLVQHNGTLSEVKLKEFMNVGAALGVEYGCRAKGK